MKCSIYLKLILLFLILPISTSTVYGNPSDTESLKTSFEELKNDLEGISKKTLDLLRQRET
ncbi:hypothetical protein LCGC14_2642010, partial [marine sediment metagenome]